MPKFALGSTAIAHAETYDGPAELVVEVIAQEGRGYRCRVVWSTLRKWPQGSETTVPAWALAENA